MKHASEITVESEASSAIKSNSHVPSESKFKTAFNLGFNSLNSANFFSSQTTKLCQQNLFYVKKKNTKLSTQTSVVIHWLNVNSNKKAVSVVLFFNVYDDNRKSRMNLNIALLGVTVELISL